MFKHNFLPKVSLERVATPEGRYYKTAEGVLYPSVTTVLGRRDASWLNEWKARVGEEEALAISRKASRRGTAVHDIIEKYLFNEHINKMKIIPTTYISFKTVQPELNKNIDEIYGIEHFIYSHTLKTAGATDMICKWNGTNSIIDFKTAKYNKTEDQIQNYFIQTTAYGMMVNELFNANIKQIVVIIIVDHEKNPQIFVKDIQEYQNMTREIFS